MDKETALCIKFMRVEVGCTWRKIAGVLTNDKNPDQCLGESYCLRAMEVLDDNFA